MSGIEFLFTCPLCEQPITDHAFDCPHAHLGDRHDLVLVESTERVFGSHVGKRPLWVHGRSVCRGPNCIIHNPSDHRMREWTLVWRADRGFFERLCPAHGVGHPDPDGLEHVIAQGMEGAGIHGCCGCCRPETTAPNSGQQRGEKS